MTEQLLQFIWKYRLFDQNGLQTLGGEPVEVLKPGEQNHDAGADFTNARLKIGDTLWAGNVEIELNSANWHKHGHSIDASHNNTILLVCLHHDAKEEIAAPVLIIGDRVKPELISNYQTLMDTQAWIPCQSLIHKADPFTMQSWLLRILAERLEQKIQPILAALQTNNNNWEETFYHTLARNFGFNTNAVPFELLAKSLPLAVLAKHKNSLLQIEALLLGQSGLLEAVEEEHRDAYVQNLLKEYSFLKHKYRLESVNAALWKFSKTRPANFPTQRIAQFAALVHTSSHLFSKILENPDVHYLRRCFKTNASAYWETHYRPGIPTQSTHNVIGDDALDNILINTVAPFLFAYGHVKREENYKQSALRLLERLPAENNNVIRGFASLDIKAANAAEGQAMLQLYKHWCMPKKCLQCRIGYRVMNS